MCDILSFILKLELQCPVPLTALAIDTFFAVKTKENVLTAARSIGSGANTSRGFNQITAAFFAAIEAKKLLALL